MIIGLTGAARSGKDTAAKIIADKYNYNIRSFAAPIRSFIANLCNVDNMNVFDSIKDIPNISLNNKTPRYAMQTLGTEWGRKMISDTIWVDKCLSGETNIVITDVRFENEAQAIIKKGGYIIKIIRPDNKISESDHISESGIPDKYITYTIINNYDIDTYKSNIINIISNL